MKEKLIEWICRSCGKMPCKALVVEGCVPCNCILDIHGHGTPKWIRNSPAGIKESRPTVRAKRPVQQRKAKIVRSCVSCDIFLHCSATVNSNVCRVNYKPRTTSAVA